MPGIDDKAKLEGSRNAKFISDTTITLTTDFAVQSFGFNAISIIISNDDATNYIEYSWNGSDIHGKILAGETLIVNGISQRDIQLRGQSGGEKFRIWIW